MDYVRVDGDGKALADPFCYRDERTVKAERALHRKISPERLRELTGVQLMRINTLYQLYADAMQELPEGRQWLNLPEYILSRWGGARVAEHTNATHTRMVELHQRQWCREIFSAAHLDLACCGEDCSSRDGGWQVERGAGGVAGAARYGVDCAGVP